MFRGFYRERGEEDVGIIRILREEEEEGKRIDQTDMLWSRVASCRANQACRASTCSTDERAIKLIGGHLIHTNDESTTPIRRRGVNAELQHLGKQFSVFLVAEFLALFLYKHLGS